MSMCNKYTAFNFGLMHCAFSKIVLHFLLSFFNKMVADASFLRKNGIDWNFHPSKPVLAGALGLRNTILPVCLSMVKVHPAKSVIFLLAVSCLV